MSGNADMSDDALLSAYLDGELAEDESLRLRDRLTGDPALSRRLEDMRGADRAVQSVYATADELPLPQGVLDLLNDRDAGSRGDRADAGNVVSLPARGLRRFLEAPVAIAASVALAVGFLAGDMLRRTPESGAPFGPSLYAGAIPQTSELHDLLESGVSTEPELLAGEVRGTLLLTFESKEGEWCRQVQLASGSGSMQALACRHNGAWQMEAVTYEVPAAPGSDYQAASSRSATALEAAIDERIGDQAPLGAEEESLLISNGWK